MTDHVERSLAVGGKTYAIMLWPGRKKYGLYRLDDERGYHPCAVFRDKMEMDLFWAFLKMAAA